MYDCLTAQEETQLFLEAMDEYEKHLDIVNDNNEPGEEEELAEGLEANVNDDDEEQAPLLPLVDQKETKKNVYTERQVKNNPGSSNSSPIFFIAGRGGETNFYAGNAVFRDRVLQYTHAYVQAGTKGRGKKFARWLMTHPSIRITSNVVFVVRLAYFQKNVLAGKISTPRKNSVLQEHAPRTLEEILAQKEASHHYWTIGEEWIVGIITDLLRTSASKFMSSSSLHNTKTPSPPRHHSTAVAVAMPINNNNKRQRIQDPAPCPEVVSIPEGSSSDAAGAAGADGRMMMMPPCYQPHVQYHAYHQQTQLPFPQHQHHHEDCSLSSVSYSDDDCDLHSHSEHSRDSSSSPLSASNDMFLFLSSSLCPPSSQLQQMMMTMPPILAQKRARMTVLTTTIPTMPNAAQPGTASPYEQAPFNHSWWQSESTSSSTMTTTAGAAPMMMMTLDQQSPPPPQASSCSPSAHPWDNVVVVGMQPILAAAPFRINSDKDSGYSATSNNHRHHYSYGDNSAQPQVQQQQQQQPFHGYEAVVWRTQEV